MQHYVIKVRRRCFKPMANVHVAKYIHICYPSFCFILPPSHGNPCVEDLEEVLLFRKNFSAANPSWPDPLKASGRIRASKLHQRDTDVVGVELPSHVGKKSCMKISSGRPAWMSSPAYLRTYCTFFEKTFWQPSRILVFQRENEVLESSSIKMNKRQYPELPFCIMQGFLFISQKLKKSLEEVGCTNFYVTEVVHILLRCVYSHVPNRRHGSIKFNTAQKGH